jgi:hypothetical protein
MRRSLSGWGSDDLATLYEGFGFTRREGANHTIYSHPKYPDLYATVGRHTELAKGYVETAIKRIDTLREREAAEALEQEMGDQDDSEDSDEDN